MSKPKRTRIFIGFATDEWSDDSFFHATLETPSAPYPLSFGRIGDAECQEEGVAFSETAFAFAAVRRLIAADLGAQLEVSEIAAHQLDVLTKSGKLCAADDCDQCC